jgi:hypothetical protein
VKAGLIVIGPYREARRIDRILGTTAQKLIHEVNTPVLLATRSFDHPPGRSSPPSVHPRDPTRSRHGRLSSLRGPEQRSSP